MEGENARECQESEQSHEFYKLHTFVEKHMTEFPCWKRSPRDTEVLLYCLGCTLVDLSKFILLTIEEGASSKRVRVAVFMILFLVLDGNFTKK